MKKLVGFIIALLLLVSAAVAGPTLSTVKIPPVVLSGINITVLHNGAASVGHVHVTYNGNMVLDASNTTGKFHLFTVKPGKYTIFAHPEFVTVPGPNASYMAIKDHITKFNNNNMAYQNYYKAVNYTGGSVDVTINVTDNR